jgi:hypothetical protein
MHHRRPELRPYAPLAEGFYASGVETDHYQRFPYIIYGTDAYHFLGYVFSSHLAMCVNHLGNGATSSRHLLSSCFQTNYPKGIGKAALLSQYGEALPIKCRL